MINPLDSQGNQYSAVPPGMGKSEAPPDQGKESYTPSSAPAPNRRVSETDLAQTMQSASSNPVNAAAPSTGQNSAGVPLDKTSEMLFNHDQSIYRIWDFETGGAINSTPAVAAGDTLIFGSTDGKIYGVRDGNKVWDFDAGGKLLSSPQLTEDGLLLCSSSNGKIYAVRDGSKLWEYDTETSHGQGIVGHPVEGPGGLIYAGAGNGQLHFLRDGRDEYGAFIGDWILTPVIGKDGTIYVKGYGGKISALKYTDSFFGKKVKTLWELETGLAAQRSESSLALGGDGTVYTGTYDGKVCAIRKGKPVWEFQTNGTINSTPVIGPDGTVYVGSDDKSLYAIKDGKKLWEFKTKGAVQSRPAIGEDGVVYAGSDDGTVYGIKDGQMVWHFDTKGPVRSSPVVRPGGTIFVTSNDGKLYGLSRSPVKERYSEIQDTPGENKPGISRQDEWVIIDGTKLPVKKEGNGG